MFKRPSWLKTEPVSHNPSPLFERLEGRQLLSASLAGGILNVTGTPGEDMIVISINADDPTQLDVSQCGTVRSFPLNKVTKFIRVATGAGEDSIEIDETNGAINIPLKASGGAGDDLIVGGSAIDVLNGGRGDDDLHGGGALDKLTGGRGEDVFQSTDDLSEIKDLGEDDGVRIALEEAPAAVQASVLTLLDGNEIENLLRESDEGETVFELEWEADETPHSAKITLDGTVIEEEMEIDIADLPGVVVTAISALYPNATITEAETLSVPEGEFFEVEVQVGRRFRELKITLEGQIVDDELQPRE